MVRQSSGVPARRPRAVIATVGVLALLVVSVAAAVLLPTFATGPHAIPDIPEPSATGVGGFLYQDRDGDGIPGRGEPALGHRHVQVYSTGPLPIATTETDADGVFLLPEVPNVTPGETTVTIRTEPILEGPAAANLPRPTALSQSFTVALGTTATIPVASFRSCPALAECAGMDLPDLVPQLSDMGGDDYPSPTITRVDTETQPGRVLLRFATSTLNQGGLLHVTAADVSEDGELQSVQQRVYGDSGVFLHGAGRFVYHAEHNHFHLDEFERYELLSEDRSTVIASSEKISFCLTDVIAVDPPARGDGDLFLDLPPYDCGVEEQGINTGYADYYGAELPDQWIDVTGVPSGSYWIRLTVDPAGVLLESDSSNNTATFPVDYVAPDA
ncbi:lysyl oxidase family protein [Microbacterium koreense]|uniref:Lysyl oxidase family protein n=1 Tax=Microbacterium koreense TaxID=323761 RepID=A0ABW2ZSH4_9MICO